ncbi:unnamed protein product [Colias eurytheme]|nr:unnamed protein product [Colias eurytheme]CAG4954608.1 unnamed protein product [Colias eurytheme]CAG4957740.1 unnamed protein product [Colias eurytheme]
MPAVRVKSSRNHGVSPLHQLLLTLRVLGAIDCTHIRIQSPCLLIGTTKHTLGPEIQLKGRSECGKEDFLLWLSHCGFHCPLPSQ